MSIETKFEIPKTENTVHNWTCEPLLLHEIKCADAAIIATTECIELHIKSMFSNLQEPEQ